VIDATADYLKTEDRYGMWLEECFDLVANAWTSSADLFESWQAWSTANNEWVGSKRTLGLILAERHFAGGTVDNRRGFIGLRPKGTQGTAQAAADKPTTLVRVIRHQTQDAILINALNSLNDSTEVWLPKSKITMTKKQDDDRFEIIIPGWLVKEKDLINARLIEPQDVPF
jgi:hypothetical protein